MRELSVMLLCSDIVQMACYAPLFTNDNDRQFVLHAFVPSGIVIYDKCSDSVLNFFSDGTQMR